MRTTRDGPPYVGNPDPAFWAAFFRGPKDQTNIRILHPGSKAQYKGDSRNHGFVGNLAFRLSFGLLSLGPPLGSYGLSA